MGKIIVCICCLLVIGAGAYAYYKIKRKITHFSNQVFGTDTLAAGLRAEKERLSVTPKSVSAMTRVYEPQIQRDFPEFNWEEFRCKAETVLTSYLLCITNQKSMDSEIVSEDLQEQLRYKLEDLRLSEKEEIFRDITIHATEICRYEKKQGTCVITIQCAVGYMHYLLQKGELIQGSRDLLEQTKYNIELMYVQDVDNLGITASGLSLVCPQCGAPVKTLGSNKYCEYCGSAITAINIHTWAFNKIYEL